ncbi:hypothetical protein QBC47DRAFT_370806 [Echria macrotheca]|uniref:Uncharacterized protein n=1 Tax=Echria macrotheca TaxID=438768 RepID=A0AAJ0BIQ2_9PEZI|nr:hypothetical protein QBC47DRAFT_370806 [Echria macrotheca]
MRFSLALLALPAVLAIASEGPTPVDFGAVEARSLLEGRACKYTGCKCDTSNRNRKPQGQFCGGCKWPDGTYVITPASKRDTSHVYECSPSGDCCDYGFASDCGHGGRCGG